MPALTEGLLCARCPRSPWQHCGRWASLSPSFRRGREGSAWASDVPVRLEKLTSTRPKPRPPGRRQRTFQSKGASRDRKESPAARLPQATAAPLTPPTTPSCFPAVELVLGPGRVRGPRGRPQQMATLAEAGRPRGARPSFALAENKGLSRASSRRRGGGRSGARQVHREGPAAQRARLARGSGSGPHSQGGRRALAAREGPVCPICQRGGQAF